MKFFQAFLIVSIVCYLFRLGWKIFRDSSSGIYLQNLLQIEQAVEGLLGSSLRDRDDLEADEATCDHVLIVLGNVRPQSLVKEDRRVWLTLLRFACLEKYEDACREKVGEQVFREMEAISVDDATNYFSRMFEVSRSKLFLQNPYGSYVWLLDHNDLNGLE